LNLVPDKRQAFCEVFRVLKPGGHFTISDVVLKGTLPENLRQAAEMYAGCVSGASQESDYLGLIHDLGFANVSVQGRKPIVVPDDILANYLSPEERMAFKNSEVGIFSITVSATKPLDRPEAGGRTQRDKAELKAACCGSGSNCC